MNHAPDCNTCRAWDQQPTEPGEPDSGLCRRHPPRTEVVLTVGDDGEEVPQICTAWATTLATGDGCWDWVEMEKSS